MVKNIGINTVNFSIEKVKEFGIGRAEICLGRGSSYESRLKEGLRHIRYAEDNKIPFSIHLPLYVEDWYPYDYLSAYFLDPNEELRRLALRLLEYNLEKLKNAKAEYLVLHFGGVYDDFHNKNEFNKWIDEALRSINALGEQYNKKILIEYFGSNRNFADYSEWIKIVNKYNNLGILTDTGHLYFASIINKFDFIKALDILIDGSEAFHVWTTKGKDVYFKSDFYKNYHHIVPKKDQYVKDGWAFDTEIVMEKLKKTNKPIIIEASMEYRGESYFLEGVKDCIEMIRP